MNSTAYVQGCSPRETQRLIDQSGSLAELLHHDTAYPPGSRVLEAGSGVGAKTVELTRRSPDAENTSRHIERVPRRRAPRERAIVCARQHDRRIVSGVGSRPCDTPPPVLQEP